MRVLIALTVPAALHPECHSGCRASSGPSAGDVSECYSGRLRTAPQVVVIVEILSLQHAQHAQPGR